MYYTDEQQKEMLLQQKIKEIKLCINSIIKNYQEKEQALGIISMADMEEKRKLYGYLIGMLNETFYGYNITSMMKILREKGFQIPHSDIIYLMNVDELYHYKSMLNKLLTSIKMSKTLNEEILMSYAADIGIRAKKFFTLKYNEEPFEVLTKRLDNEYNKKAKEKEKQEKVKNELQELKNLRKELKQLKIENSGLKKMLKIEKIEGK